MGASGMALAAAVIAASRTAAAKIRLIGISIMFDW
jgi:hypothetical protein